MPAAQRPATAPSELPVGSARGGEIRALTGLRAVAAGWVVLVHFGSVMAIWLDQAPFLRPLLAAGWIGVELFFVLSGFLLTRGYLDEVGRRPTPRAVARFLINRFARVWPAWAAVTVAMAAWIWAVRAAGYSPDVLTVHPAVSVEQVVRQLTMTQMWDRSTMLEASYVPPGWSISAEWAAYLAFPLLAVLLRPLRRMHPVVSLVLAHLAIAPLAVLGFTTGPLDGEQSWLPRIACGFVAGAFVALALRDVRRTERTESIGLVLSVVSTVLLVLLCYWAGWRRGPELADHAQVAVIVFPSLIAGLTLSTRGPARLLANSAMVYGGRISYCVYLTHYLLLDVAFAVVWQNLDDRGVITPGIGLLVPCLLVGTVGVSAGLYHWVEEPARRAILRRTPRRADVPAPGRPEHLPVRLVPAAGRHEEAATVAPRRVVVAAPAPRAGGGHHAARAGSR